MDINELDEMLDDEIIVLTGANGEEIEFIEIAGIALNDKYYVILQPVELIEGIEEDEALVFEFEHFDAQHGNYKLITDDETVDLVFDEYNRLLQEALKEEAGE